MNTDSFFTAVLVTAATIVSYVCFALIILATSEAQCLELGWPKARIDFRLNAYCIKRVNQTDVVRPLKDLIHAA
jgi:hypothetical protein